MDDESQDDDDEEGRGEGEGGEADEESPCIVCGGGVPEDSIVLCDGCNCGFHFWCMDPPRDAVPEEPEWFCPACAIYNNDNNGDDDDEIR